ncbi:hypothetical protein BS78_05G280800 [Paspalum vaginatum]|nr:hypothetical protein BS78_05G280800 [Paspalum vaginatum]
MVVHPMEENRGFYLLLMFLICFRTYLLMQFYQVLGQ